VIWWKFACTRRTRGPKTASRSPARASAAASRSMPTIWTSGEARSRASEWPPRPSVPSTKIPPR
jgi:hypothetical protein